MALDRPDGETTVAAPVDRPTALLGPLAAPEKGSGVYMIVCRATGGVYVGSAAVMARRWKRHRKDLRAGNHINPKLQNAWNKYGEDAFDFRVIQCVPVDRLVPHEQFHMDYFRSHKSYNIRTTAESNRGLVVSAETRAKLSAANMGRKLSPEGIAALKARKGEKRSEAHKAKQRLIWLGRKHTPESIAKMRANNKGLVPPSFKGRKHTGATLEKLRRASTGRRHTPEVLAKMAGKKPSLATIAAHSRRPLSDATKDKIRLARSGWKPKAETIAKMQAAHIDDRWFKGLWVGLGDEYVGR